MVVDVERMRFACTSIKTPKLSFNYLAKLILVKGIHLIENNFYKI